MLFCVVWEAAIRELPGGNEEDRGGLRLVLSLYFQHPIRLQLRQHTWLVHHLIKPGLSTSIIERIIDLESFLWLFEKVKS